MNWRVRPVQWAAAASLGLFASAACVSEPRIGGSVLQGAAREKPLAIAGLRGVASKP